MEQQQVPVIPRLGLLDTTLNDGGPAKNLLLKILNLRAEAKRATEIKEAAEKSLLENMKELSNADLQVGKVYLVGGKAVRVNAKKKSGDDRGRGGYGDAPRQRNNPAADISYEIEIMDLAGE